MKTQGYEIAAWLGGNWSDEDTVELIERIQALGEGASEVDWIVVCQDFDGTLDVTEIMADYFQARNHTEETRQMAHAVIRQLARDGMSEVQIAERTGVTRMTVRNALGKKAQLFVPLANYPDEQTTPEIESYLGERAAILAETGIDADGYDETGELVEDNEV